MSLTFASMLFQIGNAFVDDQTFISGTTDYYWNHALISDEAVVNIRKICHSNIYTIECASAREKGASEYGSINVNSIYSPLCHEISNSSIGSVSYTFRGL
ncbi:hypothetical protein FRX31_014381 [Thalictrum thalictroides]|uniref:Uncharacterized protein n=1 Tax=Thalictrum thalictroides TaxID=46969 RepID=A0A7J6WHX2_THATH|nr:hypothetical protein FRX31_014381 [Thalictrum thalictroides]